MRFIVEKTPEGNRWVKKTYNRKTEKVETEELPIGEALVFDPEELIERTDILLGKETPVVAATDAQGNVLSFEDFMQKVIDKAQERKFKPGFFYSKAGDILQVYWEDAAHFARALGNGVDVHIKFKDNKDAPDEVIGVTLWGIKNKLLEAYAEWEDWED